MRSIPVGDFQIGDDEKNAVIQVLSRGRLSENFKTAEFEREFAAYIGTKHCVAVSSGSAALLCLLAALVHDDKYHKVKPGAKVITTPLTYIATINAIVLAGLEPVFVDVDRKTFGILPNEVERVLMETDGVCAVLPVHLMGYPCAMDELRSLADQFDLLLIEDAAQAHGSTYSGKKCGSLGVAGIFSFYIAHNIQAGEMGCITTDDADLVRLLKKIKANGRACDCIRCTRPGGYCPRLSDDVWTGVMDGDPRFIHDIIGYNFKVMEFPPSLALTQLKKADAIFKARQDNVQLLNKCLASFSDVLDLPIFDTSVSYLAYPLVVKPDKGIHRGSFRQALHGYGVESRPLFGCIPLHQPAYKKYKEKYSGKLPNAEHLGEHAFYIACHQYLQTSDIEFIKEAISASIDQSLVRR